MSIYVAAKPAVKAGPIGPGAGVLQTQYPLSMGLGLGQQSPQKKMERAWRLGIEVPWIRAAERVIGGAFASVAWHLEDENEEEITDEATGDLGDAYNLIAKPQANLAVGRRLQRSELWRLTCRHMGLCGNSFWYLDEQNTYGIPRTIIYIRPDRMTPQEDAKGNLIGWWIDKTPTDPGIAVRLDQIIQFILEPPDMGHFGIGLVESAVLKLNLSTKLDKHLQSVLDAGGRISGIMSPKAGAMSPDQMLQMERDWRTIVEQPDAAKRLQLAAAPVDFTSTTMSPSELQIRDLMTGARDDLLGLWGVPISKLGIHDRGRALGASAVIESDDATLWSDAVLPRLGNSDQGGFVEAVQTQLLDPYLLLGQSVELVIEPPTFDDDAPKYVEAQQAIAVPMRNRDRLAILGMEPFGREVVNPETGVPYDDEVWLPATSVRAFVAPSEGQQMPTIDLAAPVTTPTVAALTAGETTQAKAKIDGGPLHASLVKLRANIERTMTPRVKTAVASLLTEQRKDIAKRLREHAAHITANPGDTAIWFPSAKWDKRLREVLGGHLAGVAETVSGHIGSVLPAKATPAAVERVLDRGAARVTKINQTTRDRVAAILATAIEQGSPILEVADALDSEAIFDDYRAEMIAGTELMDAYNSAAITSYQDAGIEMLDAIDGDEDQECIDRVAGNPYTVEDAAAEEDHPNGTLDWVPAGMDTELVSEAKASTPEWLPLLITAISQPREPMSVTIVNPEPPKMPTHTVLDFNPAGKVIGSHEEAD